MDFNEIYMLQEAFDRDSLRVKSVEPRLARSEAILVANGSLLPERPIVLQRSSGTVAKDFVGCELVAIKLVSTRVTRLLQGAGISGWKTYPIALMDVADDCGQSYQGLSVVGRCGPIDKSKSLPAIGTFDSRSPRTTSVGLYFDEGTWDGSDIFRPQATLLTFVTSRVKRLFDEHDVTNVAFKPITEAEQMMA